MKTKTAFATARLKHTNAPEMSLAQEYLRMKSLYPKNLLMIRAGDFYEFFFTDARIAASVLEISLTQRSNNDEEPAVMAGVVIHTLEKQLSILVAEGHTVSICERDDNGSFQLSRTVGPNSNGLPAVSAKDARFHSEYGL